MAAVRAGSRGLRAATRRGVVAHAGRAPAARPVVDAVLGAGAVQLIGALPAAAEAGKLFDFDATLPIMAGQFLLLMVVLDKTWFSPVGAVLDERDEKIRGMLASVQDNSDDISSMEAEAKACVADARAAAQAMMAEKKKGAEAETTAKLKALKDELDAEYSALLSQLEAEKEQAYADLKPKVEELASSIVSKLVPA